MCVGGVCDLLSLTSLTPHTSASSPSRSTRRAYLVLDFRAEVLAVGLVVSPAETRAVILEVCPPVWAAGRQWGVAAASPLLLGWHGVLGCVLVPPRGDPQRSHMCVKKDTGMPDAKSRVARSLELPSIRRFEMSMFHVINCGRSGQFPLSPFQPRAHPARTSSYAARADCGTAGNSAAILVVF